MTMEVTHLGTGSRGNATLIATDETAVLIDQGFSCRQLERRLAAAGRSPKDLDAILITHHPGDHAGGAARAHRRWGTPIHANQRTLGQIGMLGEEGAEVFDALDLIDVMDLSLLPVPVPHSGADNVAFIASHQGHRAAVVTDLGSWTEELVQHLKPCEHIAIEANYDHARLANGPYPTSLKDRILSRGGHLSNQQTAELLDQVVSDVTKSITLTHLSVENNRPHLAESEVLMRIDDRFEGDVSISLQDGPTFSHHLG